MIRYYDYSADFDKETEELFKKAIFLGEGHNGIVYELLDNKAIKIFRDKNCCREEADILKKVKKSKYFPKVYSVGEYYIVREKIGGKRLDHYIKRNGLSFELSKNLYDLLEEFRHLNFSKLDARCRDIYVLENEKVRVIDPKQCYKKVVAYPRHLMKGLKKIDVLQVFLDDIKKINSKKAKLWEKKINQYFYEN